MKFCPLKTAAAEPSTLAPEYRAAKKMDVFRMGERHLFFRRKMRVCYIAYAEIDRFFRRVLQVPIRVSCCGGEMGVEHIVLSSGGEELAVILLADPRMAPPVMEELKARAPHAASVKPPVEDGGENG
ncbi:hypothetical protein [uncultured Oscillibacter sp.]|uniref:hypothetical protein n=1 Tax=uncultured Oscillibacter sp. TaxID=876091 RepID=UPI0025EBED88|nr:hypothetical protein [uncultured Oscillibacter sp.]